MIRTISDETHDLDFEELGKDQTYSEDFQRGVETLLIDKSNFDAPESEIAVRFGSSVLSQEWVKAAAIVQKRPGDSPSRVDILFQSQQISLGISWTDLFRSYPPTEWESCYTAGDGEPFLEKVGLKSRGLTIHYDSCPGILKDVYIFVVVEDIRAPGRGILRASTLFLAAMMGPSRGKSHAARSVSYMTAQSIEMAQFYATQINKAVRGLRNYDDATTVCSTARQENLEITADCIVMIRDQMGRLCREIEDAARALKRGLSWQTNTPHKPELSQISIGQLIKEAIDELEEVVWNPFIQENKCSHHSFVAPEEVEKLASSLDSVVILADKNRLRHAVRDVILGTWMLSDWTPLQISFQINDDTTPIVIQILGGGCTIPDDWTSEDFATTFFDPNVVRLSLNRPAERGLTFDLARLLLKQANIHCYPQVDTTGDRRRFNFRLEFKRWESFAGDIK